VGEDQLIFRRLSLFATDRAIDKMARELVTSWTPAAVAAGYGELTYQIL
jgi:hypothetical protein